jgi:hypothetical protein
VRELSYLKLYHHPLCTKIERPRNRKRETRLKKGNKKERWENILNFNSKNIKE